MPLSWRRCVRPDLKSLRPAVLMTNRDDMSDRPALSPSALNRFLACEHRTYLDIRERRGELKGLRLAPDMSLLFERGDRHEDAVVTELMADGRDLVALEDE